ncbi:hypothetical protein Ciccas_001585 [Cichlidogyrus casuarinus]|uniref:Uncharacterized protein n=1 Tax=Cichlidogyrus casuarinus TaxID=1844966 RepID=A0ABD2QJU6_9PLAT
MFEMMRDYEFENQEAKNVVSQNRQLQHQIDTLASELEQYKEFSTRPTVRELTLESQVQRLKQDLDANDAELQVIRTRLQDALANELKFNERISHLQGQLMTAEATEARLESSWRAKLQCQEETLRGDFSKKRTKMSQEFEEQLKCMKSQLEAAENELTYATKKSNEAVEKTLNEALQEAEKERDQIWRIEFPARLEECKQNWLSEANADLEKKITQATQAERKRVIEQEFPSKIAEVKLQMEKSKEEEVISWKREEWPKLEKVAKQEGMDECAKQNHQTIVLQALRTHEAEFDCLTKDQLSDLCLNTVQRYMIELADFVDSSLKQFSILNLQLEGYSDFITLKQHLKNVFSTLFEELATLRKENDNMTSLLHEEIPNYVIQCQQKCIDLINNRLHEVHSESVKMFVERMFKTLKIDDPETVVLMEISSVRTQSLVRMLLNVRDKMLSKPLLSPSLLVPLQAQEIPLLSKKGKGPSPLPRKVQAQSSTSTSGCSSTGNTTPRDAIVNEESHQTSESVTCTIEKLFQSNCVE